MKIRNFTPTITSMPRTIRRIASRQQPYFRTKQFCDLILENESLLLNLIGCQQGKVAFLTTSGTGAMDAAVSGIIGRNKKVLIINAGTFGSRWVDICTFYMLPHYNYKVPFGEAIDIDNLENTIRQYKPEYVLMQHNETSSMRLYPVEIIGSICSKNNCRLIVDAISSFAIDYYDMDSWNVYATILSTQKGLGLSTGMSMIVMREPPTTSGLSYYLSLADHYIKDIGDIGLPFTPNTITLNQLNYRLKEITKVGMAETMFKSYKQATDFRKRILYLPLWYGDHLSNCGTLVYTKRTDVKDLFQKLQKKNIYFTPIGGIEGKKFVIGHIGNLTIRDNKILYKELEKWLKQ